MLLHTLTYTYSHIHIAQLQPKSQFCLNFHCVIFNREREGACERERESALWTMFNDETIWEQRHKEMEGRERKEWMTSLKNKNGALQRDKLKMGIGRNERVMEAQREGVIECEQSTEKDMERLERKRSGWHRNGWRREAGRKCEAAGALLLHCWCGACLCTPNLSLILTHSLAHSLTHHLCSPFGVCT